MFENFTPWSALAGGVLIGLASLGVYVLFGRVAGISGILGNVISGERSGLDWRLGFVAGLILAPLVVVFVGGAVPHVVDGRPWLLVLAGLLVGFGSRFGNGCTSGHGICGISRLSQRSILAVATFMATAVVLQLFV